MGVYIKNANGNLKNGMFSTTSPLQQELKNILGEIWNNQDFLNSEDKEILIKLSKKGLY
jgi:hypothetical protein